MLTLRERHNRSEPEGGIGRSVRVTFVSAVAHVFLVLGLFKMLESTGAIQRIFLRDFSFEQPREQLQYLTISPPAAVTTPIAVAAPAVVEGADRAGRTRGEPSATEAPARPTVPLVAPREVPTSVPAPGAGFDVNVGTPAGGPLASGRGAVRGLQPGYVDPRVWVGAPTLIYAPKTAEERLDSAVVTSIMRYRDSVMANSYSPNKFERGDWTYATKDGKRYGIDQQYIRLGKFSIPTALLGLLPMNQLQGNPIENDRQARLAAMRVDIMRGAQAAMNEEEFRQAVKKIRARKDKERKDAETQKKAVDTRPISER